MNNYIMYFIERNQFIDLPLKFSKFGMIGIDICSLVANDFRNEIFRRIEG